MNYEGRASFFVHVGLRRWGMSAGSYPRDSPAVWFVGPWDVEVSRGRPLPNGAMETPHAYFRFAHWFLMLVFLVLWSAWLAWKWKGEEERKLM
ncbi:hypothetical protein [Luteolibacter soli]|uniref:SURF1-like protein n=1 Tax=Luteolibacter soli TaxID=3135280 RepID=A0ABU9AV37_9BACT